METVLNFLQDILLIDFKSYAKECMDLKEGWGEEGEVVIITLT
jgi:hypothetical protein